MRVVLVGSASRRHGSARCCPTTLEVVAEVATVSEARRIQDVDGYLVHAAHDETTMARRTSDATRARGAGALADGLSNKAIAARLGSATRRSSFI